jgi:hypothetical protein
VSGLLQRLGARATGTAWAVRSDARLPFGAERLADLQVPQDADPAPLAGMAEPLSARAVDLAAAHLAADTPARDAAASPLGHADLPHTLKARAQPAAQVLHVPEGLLPPQRVPARVRQPMATDAAAQAPAALHTVAMAALEAAPATAAMPAHVLAPSAGLPRTDAPAIPGTPAPLLPARPRNDVQPHRARSAPAQPFGPQRAPSTAPQETEVHIHIGRIDVTALHEAPRPKARPRERAQPMSLDAYLSRREGAK